MCIFCAAVPAAASLGAAANVKQKHAKKTPEPARTSASRAAWLLHVPVGKATGTVIASLLVASVVYHSQVGPA